MLCRLSKPGSRRRRQTQGTIYEGSRSPLPDFAMRRKQGLSSGSAQQIGEEGKPLSISLSIVGDLRLEFWVSSSSSAIGDEGEESALEL
ncbi:unnamed protein product [Linum trigynum]|uniref:Uncharacterized protein n=1 Tax=Linum trigynum TaxID=586398 RepID=A0AAV2D546_9ROSI